MNAPCKSRIQQKLKIFKRRRFPRFPAESQILVEEILKIEQNGRNLFSSSHIKQARFYSKSSQNKFDKDGFYL